MCDENRVNPDDFIELICQDDVKQWQRKKRCAILNTSGRICSGF